MNPSSTLFVLPDLLASCPYKPGANPHYQEAAAESRAWINSYNIFTNRKRAFFVLGSNELLVSRAYNYAGYEQFRTCCDFVNLLFVVDEVSDDQSGKDAYNTGRVFVNAMRDPEWDDHSILAKITKEFRARFVRHAGPNSTRRFLKRCEAYTDCVAREAGLRERGEVLDLESFTALRRENSAVRLCFGLFEYVLGIDLPEEVFQDPTFMKMYFAAVDHVCWANDVYSYDMEQAKGHHGNNVVTVLMKDKNMSLQEASDYIGEHCKQLVECMQYKADLPSWGPEIDAQVATYIQAMEYWMIGNLVWSFETERYFGSNHWEVKRTRVVNLRPREAPEETDPESDFE